MLGQRKLSALPHSIGALGVVFGEIGTSVLYAFRGCLHDGIDTERDIIGVLSMIIWSLFTIVSLKYLAIVMRADNQGEGGILALLSLAFSKVTRTRGVMTGGLMTIGIAGAALLYGDGVITPALAVLAAIGELRAETPKIAPFIIPLSLGILMGLFAVQSKGTGAIGKWFGKVMLVWFLVLAVLGITNIATNPSVLRALNPLEGFDFLTRHGTASLFIMGSVFLVVTGSEALYADMGHFGRKAISRAWTFLVCPALILNYLGQGALVLVNPAARENPFINMAPNWARFPLVALATAAAIIASQAFISGAFSLARQGIQMGYIPRMEILHTSKDEHGQIYIPRLNIILAIGCAAMVLGFGNSDALAGIYGVALNLTMLATTAIFFFVAQRLWGWSPLRAGLTCLLFGSIEAIFLAANSLKIMHGGLLPLVLGAGIFIVMMTWRDGRSQLRKSLPPGMPLDDFIASISIAGSLDEQNILHRSQGTAVFLAEDPDGIPNALIKNLKHNQILHRQNIVLTIITDANRPYVMPEYRAEVSDRTEGFFRVITRFGFMESPNIEQVIRLAGENGLAIHLDKTTFYVGKERIVVAEMQPGISAWRVHLFAFLSNNAESAVDYLQIRSDRLYEVSQVVEM
ncbi:MAG: system potassium uptake protein [Chthoniobacter sp.]|jgi:KUP system potassium uptake protein|nr:system potassium uptake protein [Chthoniobacter sp.]